MEKVEEYKRMAIQARTKAGATTDDNVRRQFLQIADEWDALAQARITVLGLKGREKRR